MKMDGHLIILNFEILSNLNSYYTYLSQIEVEGACIFCSGFHFY